MNLAITTNFSTGYSPAFAAKKVNISKTIENNSKDVVSKAGAAAITATVGALSIVRNKISSQEVPPAPKYRSIVKGLPKLTVNGEVVFDPKNPKTQIDIDKYKNMLKESRYGFVDIDNNPKFEQEYTDLGVYDGPNGGLEMWASLQHKPIYNNTYDEFTIIVNRDGYVDSITRLETIEPYKNHLPQKFDNEGFYIFKASRINCDGTKYITYKDNEWRNSVTVEYKPMKMGGNLIKAYRTGKDGENIPIDTSKFGEINDLSMLIYLADAFS